MSHFRSEYSIPVKRDGRTFEQRHSDTLSNLERSYGTHTSSTVSESSSSRGNRLLPFSDFDDWDKEVNEWVAGQRSRMDEEMQWQRGRMLPLLPTEFDMDKRSIGLESNNSSSMIGNRRTTMEQELNEMRSRMGTLSTRGSTMTPSLGERGTNVQQTSSTRYVSTSKSSGSDPKDRVVSTKVEESSKESITKDGVTTGSSSHSASATTAKGDEAPIRTTESRLLSRPPGTDLSQYNITGRDATEFLKNAYEINENGQVQLRVQYDAKDFAPEDIEVTTVENRLTVQAKRSTKVGSSSSSREFCRTLDLPNTIDHESIQCHLTEDGVLTVDLPIKSPEYPSLKFTKDHELAIQPRTQAERQTSSNELKLLGQKGPTIIREPGGRKIHIEIPVERGFQAEDLLVRVDDKRLIVSGNVAKGSGKQEFTHTYTVPETLDPASVSAQLSGNLLVIEAPLLH